MSGTAAGRIVRVTDLQLIRTIAHGERREAHHYSVNVSARPAHDAAQLDAVRLADAVRALAPAAAAEGPEAYAGAVARHLVQKVTGITAASVDVNIIPWSRLELSGRPRDRDFMAASGGTRIARVDASGDTASLSAGFRDLALLTVQESGPLSVHLDALWSYGWSDIPFDTQWQQVRRALVESFTERQVDVGEDLARALASAVLEQSPAVQTIEVRLRVGTHEVVDLTAYGMESSATVVAGTPAWRSSYEVTMARAEVET